MRLLMMGTGPFAVPTFKSLLDSEHTVVALCTRPTPPPRGRRKSPPNPMLDVAQERQLSVLAPEDVNAPQAISQLAELSPDLLVVCDYGQILSQQALSVARLCGINLHGSLLPKYRGAAPVNWAIYHGESRTGVTVIHMTPKLDGGPTLAFRETEIGSNEAADELEQRLSHLGVEPVHEAIEVLASWDGTSTIGQPQDHAQATKAPRLKRQDGLVNWSGSAEQIRNQVRAFKPWPGTFTFLKRPDRPTLRLILEQVSLTDEIGADCAPGQVVDPNPERLLIATGQGVLSVEEIKPAGKRVMQIKEFLRGYPLGNTDQFGAES